jgi:hypothetical protein
VAVEAVQVILGQQELEVQVAVELVAQVPVLVRQEP